MNDTRRVAKQNGTASKQETRREEQEKRKASDAETQKSKIRRKIERER